MNVDRCELCTFIPISLTGLGRHYGGVHPDEIWPLPPKPKCAPRSRDEMAQARRYYRYLAHNRRVAERQAVAA